MILIIELKIKIKTFIFFCFKKNNAEKFIQFLIQKNSYFVFIFFLLWCCFQKLQTKFSVSVEKCNIKSISLFSSFLLIRQIEFRIYFKKKLK